MPASRPPAGRFLDVHFVPTTEHSRHGGDAAQSLWRRSRDVTLTALLEGPAHVAQRTGPAVRTARTADRAAEVHDGLVVLSRAPRWQSGCCRTPHAASDGRLCAGSIQRLQPHEHAHDVRIEGHDVLAEREAQYGVGDVRPNARQRQERAPVARDAAPVLPGDDACGLPQASGPAVVAQPLPESEDLGLGGPRQGCQAAELPHPPLEVWHDRRDGRLLEHHLADPHAVGGRPAAPGQVPAVILVPAQ
jgi:hypothetical protein